MAEISGGEALLLEVLGTRFLMYVLNVEEAQLNERLQRGVQLPDKQEAVLTELVSFLSAITGELRADQFSVPSVLGVLAEFRAELGSSWTIAARKEAGGDVTLPVRRDPLSKALIELARDLFPLFLLPRPTDDQFRFMSNPAIMAPLFGHPRREDFEKAVMADKTLAKLFPQDDKHSGPHGNVYRSTGAGGGVQLSLLADMVLRNAWEYAVHGDPRPTLQTFADHSLGQIKMIRAAVRGANVTIPTLMGITGIRLQPGEELKLPWGRLREVTDQDRRVIPPGLGGQLSHTAADGSQVTIDYAGDLVMDLQVPYRIQITYDMSGPWPADLRTTEVEEHLETMRLALLLSTTREARPVALGTWWFFLDPLGQGYNVSWRDPKRAPSLAPAALSKAEAKEWTQWIEQVHVRRTKYIDVAVRRTLGAAADRADPTDALVDAVIAWENLVGSREGEPTLRISSALARLLGKTSKERAELRQQIVRLYGLRSDVVHGNRFLEPMEAVERRQEALDLTIRVLQALFLDRPDLLADCKTSSERSIRLILEG